MSNYEVGNEVVENPSNAIRMSGSCNPAPVMGDSIPAHMGKSTPLNVQDTAGIIGSAHIGTSYGFESTTKSADTTNSTTSLNTTNSEENLSAKYKYPNVKQSYPAKGGPETAFNDHS